MKMSYEEPVAGDALKLIDDQSKVSGTNIKLPEQICPPLFSIQRKN